MFRCATISLLTLTASGVMYFAKIYHVDPQMPVGLSWLTNIWRLASPENSVEVTGVFLYRNEERQNVTIFSCDVSCGCSRSSNLPQTIAAGESGVVYVTLELPRAARGFTTLDFVSDASKQIRLNWDVDPRIGTWDINAASAVFPVPDRNFSASDMSK